MLYPRMLAAVVVDDEARALAFLKAESADTGRREARGLLVDHMVAHQMALPELDENLCVKPKRRRNRTKSVDKPQGDGESPDPGGESPVE